MRMIALAVLLASPVFMGYNGYSNNGYISRYYDFRRYIEHRNYGIKNIPNEMETDVLPKRRAY